MPIGANAEDLQVNAARLANRSIVFGGGRYRFRILAVGGVQAFFGEAGLIVANQLRAKHIPVSLRVIGGDAHVFVEGKSLRVRQRETSLGVRGAKHFVNAERRATGCDAQSRARVGGEVLNDDLSGGLGGLGFG